MTRKINCWEYMGCGREPGGRHAADKGICPAAVDRSHDGTNEGTCAGRFCWAVAGTLCHNRVQGTYAGKQEDCLDCEFYLQVRAEQGSTNIRTKFLKFIHPFAASPILNHLEPVQIPGGARFITQGSRTSTGYIIQQGACLELVENEHGLHPVGHRSEGDVVGMISLLTGEPMGFHVEAETDLEAWAIHKPDFDRIPEQDPDLYAFLTELVADRFDRNGPIAERRIGPYLITDIIGKGGYSIVYKAVHLDLETPVAVKMLRHHLSMNKEFKDNFKNEARIIAGLDHPHILKVYDITSRFKTVFIACEYLTGLSLEEMITRQHRIPSDLARSFLDQLLSAMAYAGNKGLVHRDINPANIMVSKDHPIKLIDFGLACPVGTDDFMMGGNLHYLAPEVFDGEPADFRSDLFSLGITAFHTITGRLPWDAVDSGEIMKQIRHQPLPDPGKQVKHLPGSLRQFILKACEKNPDKRFQTPEEARKWLMNATDFGPDPVRRSGPVLLPGRYCCMSSGQHETRDALPGRHMDIAAATHIGHQRKTNQDRYLTCLENHSDPENHDFALLALADGMGGAIGGEIAADHVIKHLLGLSLQDDESPLNSLKRFYRKMDRDICDMADKDPYLNGMGTTLVCAVVSNNTVFWAHSGDSRLYLLHGDHLTRITRDQTLADFLIREKQITPDQAQTHYSRQVLEQYIGCGELAVQSGRFELAEDDMILLMSDGCYRHISLDTIITTCRQTTDPATAADALIKAALTEDGSDNITGVILTLRTDV
ncbi:protein kinase domain-containing protein [Desulfotignum phosphitoxidans]|uniref:Serine/threonine-protein kinase PrkC n=1 Tax=Desulfotignum phosphitoxidans DSM 13687 TaxID=1286635 RepID=S0FRI1_9BACT|nr:protein kinase [Desulfotignum phosphitoxidans]EMS77305.1 serine/threonine-protein kinase PrkC [Desulfotignum phosphitoxidans DSM 13687]